MQPAVTCKQCEGSTRRADAGASSPPFSTSGPMLTTSTARFATLWMSTALAMTLATTGAGAQSSPAAAKSVVQPFQWGGEPASLVRMSDGECLHPADAVLTRTASIFLVLHPEQTPYPLPSRTRLLLTYIAQDIATDLMRVERTADGRARLLPADEIYPPGVTLSVASFSLRHDGSLTNVDLSRVVHDGFRAALQARFDSIAARGGVGGFDSSGLPPEIPITLQLNTRIDTTDAAAPLFTLEIPIEHVATMRSGNSPPPYPEEARSLGVEASVLLTFIVDRDGSVRDESIRVLGRGRVTSIDQSRLYSAFERAAKLAVRRYRYSPAQVLGCRIQMWVQQPFVFSMAP